MEQIYFQAIGYICVSCYYAEDNTTYKPTISHFLNHSGVFSAYFECTVECDDTAQCNLCHANFNITVPYRAYYKGNDYCSPSCVHNFIHRQNNPVKPPEFRFYYGTNLTLPLLVMDSKIKIEKYDTSKPIPKPRNKDFPPMLYSRKKVYSPKDFKLNSAGIELKTNSKFLAMFNDTIKKSILSANC